MARDASRKPRASSGRRGPGPVGGPAHSGGGGGGRLSRLAAATALLLSLLALLFLATRWLAGEGSYEVTAQFQNASQLVAGNQVTVAGVPAGSVDEISLGDDGTALVRMSLDAEYAPLREGTIATIRSQSLSGVANRYVSLQLPPAGQAGEPISDGGVLPLSQTVAEVDLDAVLNTLDKPTVDDFRRVVRGFARAYAGVGSSANRTIHYANPALSTSRNLVAELTRDEDRLRRLLVDTAGLSSALASRAPDIAPLVGDLERTMSALAAENRGLSAAVAGLPSFMREFNTTAVNLRATLDDLDPLVESARPVARRLEPFTRLLRGFAADAVPALRDLDRVIRRRGEDNDLVELVALQRPLEEIAVGPVRRNGAERAGALPEAQRALDSSLPILAFLRPYVAVEGIGGFFDTFAHPGVYDATGSAARFGVGLNQFSLSLQGLPNLTQPLLPDQVESLLGLGNLRRCPGANERPAPDGSNPFTDGGQLDCDPDQLPSGR